MKNHFPVFVLLLSAFVLQSCGSKNKEDSTNTSATTEAVVDEAQVKADVAERRVRLEKAKAEKVEQRRLAAEEKAKASLTYKDASGKIVYNKAEKAPEYSGGEEAMNKYLQDNLQYPEESRNQGLEGTVFVDFVIDKEGKVRDVTASDVTGDDVDQAFKNEAIRIVSLMPTWKPGRQHGDAVDATFSIPITFMLL